MVSSASSHLLQEGVLLIQLLRFLDDFLLVFHVTLRRRVFLSFITKICRCDLHFLAITKPELRIIQQLYRQIHALGSKIEDEGVSFEFPVVVGVQLDARLTAIDLFGNDTTA